MTETTWILILFRLALLLLVQSGVSAQDFNDPQILGLTVGCSLGGVLLIFTIIILVVYCCTKEKSRKNEEQRYLKQHQGNTYFTNPNYPPGEHGSPGHENHYQHRTGGVPYHTEGGPPSQHSLNTSQDPPQPTGAPPGVWSTNSAMYRGPGHPFPPGGGPYMNGAPSPGSAYHSSLLRHPPGVISNGRAATPNVPYNVYPMYGSNPRPSPREYGSNPRPSPREYDGSNTRPSPRDYGSSPQPSPWEYGSNQRPPPAQEHRPRKSWYQKTIRAIKNIPAVFQVRQSTKATLTYQKLLAQQEAARRKAERPEHSREQPANGNVTGKPHDVGSDVKRSGKKLPRNGAVPNGDRGNIKPPRYSQYEQHEPGHQHNVSQEPLIQADADASGPDTLPQKPSGPPQTASAPSPKPPRQEPVVAKVFSDYHDPADLLPGSSATAREEGVARVFSSYDRRLNQVARGYADPRVQGDTNNNIAMVRSDYALHSMDQAGSSGQYPFVTSKFSNFPGGGGSAGAYGGNRLPGGGQRGVVLRAPSDLSRLGNYRPHSLDRTAPQRGYYQGILAENMPQQGRTRAELIRDEKASKEAAKKAAKQSKKLEKTKQQQGGKQAAFGKGKSKHSEKHGHKHQAQSQEQDKLRELRATLDQSGITRSYQTVPGPKADSVMSSAIFAAPMASKPGPQPSYAYRQQPTTHTERENISPQERDTNVTATVHPRPPNPSQEQEDPFALYALPKKVKAEAAKMAAAASASSYSRETTGEGSRVGGRGGGGREGHMHRPKSIDVHTSAAAPFVHILDSAEPQDSPRSPTSPVPPDLPPYPTRDTPPAPDLSRSHLIVPSGHGGTGSAAAHTPKSQRSLARNKSESASTDFALAGDDVTSSAFRFLEDIDTDHDASFNSRDEDM